jgi:hypothetical protein
MFAFWRQKPPHDTVMQQAAIEWALSPPASESARNNHVNSYALGAFIARRYGTRFGGIEACRRAIIAEVVDEPIIAELF